MLEQTLPDLLLKFAAVIALSGLVVWVLTRRVFERAPQGFVLVAGAVTVGLIALRVFFGDVGLVSGALCAGGALGLAGGLYAVLAIMERWARGGGG